MPDGFVHEISRSKPYLRRGACPISVNEENRHLVNSEDTSLDKDATIVEIEISDDDTETSLPSTSLYSSKKKYPSTFKVDSFPDVGKLLANSMQKNGIEDVKRLLKNQPLPQRWAWKGGANKLSFYQMDEYGMNMRLALLLDESMTFCVIFLDWIHCSFILN